MTLALLTLLPRYLNNPKAAKYLRNQAEPGFLFSPSPGNHTLSLHLYLLVNWSTIILSNPGFKGRDIETHCSKGKCKAVFRQVHRASQFHFVKSLLVLTMVVHHCLFFNFWCVKNSFFFPLMCLYYSLWFSTMMASHLASRIIPPVLGPNISYGKRWQHWSLQFSQALGNVQVTSGLHF